MAGSLENWEGRGGSVRQNQNRRKRREKKPGKMEGGGWCASGDCEERAVLVPVGSEVHR